MGFRKSKTPYDAGGVPIWLNVRQKKTAGGILKTLPTNTPVTIPAGTPVYLDKFAGGEVTILETFRVAKAVSASDVVVEVLSEGNVPQIQADMIVMKAPETVTTTGKSKKIGAVTKASDSSNLTFAITANDLGVLEAGDILVIADKAAASGASIAVIPNGLVWHDLRVREGDTAQSVAVVVDGHILEDRINPIPSCVKAILPQIIFETGV